MNISLARELSSRALYLVTWKKGAFTSNDRKLHITYDEWTDHLSIFWMNINPDTQEYKNGNLVFCQELGTISKFEEDEIEWQEKVREENKKREGLHTKK